MTSDEVRAAFLGFFEKNGHKVMPSSSLIPQGDPTLLLTTAGMVQFKPYFLGELTPPSRRLASCQKCFRTTDIESVGDSKHLTFFEMLGNFSIGDYFKREAIAWGWEFVTKYLKLPPEKLWVTIFLDDDESFGYWRELGFPEARLRRFGEAENFWGPAGNSGPCGPCSEIHFDFGEEFGCGEDSCAPNCACGRFSEIWNLVFTQYNQDESGKRTPLPRPNIDTGMGLERAAAAVSGKPSVYETDLFAPLLERVSALTGKKYGTNEDSDNAMRIVAEHGRGIPFLIADGVIPGNEGRGYVLRRLLRRAAYFGETLAHDKPLLTELTKEVITNMKHVYPELAKNQDFVLKVVDTEVEKFGQALAVGRGVLHQTLIALRDELTGCLPKFEQALREAIEKRDFLDLRDGVNNAVDHFLRDCPSWEHVLIIGGRDAVKETLKPIEDDLGKLKGAISNYKGTQPDALSKFKKDLTAIFKDIEGNARSISKQISGFETFVLHDTYGFPLELTKEIVSKFGFSVDLNGFEQEMEKQRARARASHKFEVKEALKPGQLDVEETRFVGYEDFEHKSTIVKLLVGNETVDRLEAGQEASVILDTTPFYGEMGGQMGDTGEIRSLAGRFKVTNTVRMPQGDIILHQGKVVDGNLSIGDEVEAIVDKERRLDIARNHTATHLLQSALRQVLGGHVEQRGSLVAPDRLRFDFSHLAAPTREEIRKIEGVVNDKIRQNLPVYTEETSYRRAIEEGAMALFSEKYGDAVRVMKIGKPIVSAELCGGTHINTTGEIGYFHIIGESSIGAGLRRIEAVTGREAEAFMNQSLSRLEKIGQSLGASPENIEAKLDDVLAELDKERKRAQALERELARKEVESLLSKVEVVKGVNLLVARLPSVNPSVLRDMADFIRDRLKSGIIVLGTVHEDRPAFLAAVTSDLVAKGYNAGDIVKQVAKVAGGGGGGKPNLAQAGGKFKDKVDEALRMVKGLI
ncbi:MAG: alanine--tRNA ligase [Chloroflexi bacterium]|nr:alanine--tRNA ligase [Chloroflexota bacterium]